MSKGHNNPPVVELDADEAKLVFDIFDRDMGQALAVLGMVQEGKLSEDAARKVVVLMEEMRPLHRKLKEALNA